MAHAMAPLVLTRSDRIEVAHEAQDDARKSLVDLEQVDVATVIRVRFKPSGRLGRSVSMIVGSLPMEAKPRSRGARPPARHLSRADQYPAAPVDDAA